MFLLVNFIEEVQGKVKLDGIEYMQAFGDKNTPEYKQLASEFCEKVGLIRWFVMMIL